MLKKILKKESDGFTFVETIAVLAIGAILAAGAVISTSRMIEISRRMAAKNQLSQFSSALQCYFLDCGRFPTSEQGLMALWVKPELYPVPQDWAGPYLNKKPGQDPWGNEYKYFSGESGNLPADVPASLPFVLISYGPDGMAGGTKEGADIVSWE